MRPDPARDGASRRVRQTHSGRCPGDRGANSETRKKGQGQMIPAQLSPFANHLWQSTVFACVAALLTFALRKNRAQVRYWLWLAASIKFLIPFSLLVNAGSRIDWRTA